MIRILKKGKAKKIIFVKSIKDNIKKSQKVYEVDLFDDDVAENLSKEEEVTYLTKEAVSKLQSFSWIADTNAFSHMTNKLNLFSDSLTRIKRRIIKVKGGELHVDYMEIVILRSRSGKKVIIERVYYIFGLGANLLLCRRLCMLGLKGRFDINFIYL